MDITFRLSGGRPDHCCPALAEPQSLDITFRPSGGRAWLLLFSTGRTLPESVHHLYAEWWTGPTTAVHHWQNPRVGTSPLGWVVDGHDHCCSALAELSQSLDITFRLSGGRPDHCCPALAEPQGLDITLRLSGGRAITLRPSGGWAWPLLSTTGKTPVWASPLGWVEWWTGLTTTVQHWQNITFRFLVKTLKKFILCKDPGGFFDPSPRWKMLSLLAPKYFCDTP
jgi:hypothetical protein